MVQKIVCVHRGGLGDNRLWYSTYEESGVRSAGHGVWSGDTLLSNGAQSAKAPAVTVHNGVLHCVHRGNNADDRLWWSRFEPSTQTWSTDNVFSHGQRSSEAPAIASYQGKLFCVYEGASDTNLYYSIFDDATHDWLPRGQLPSALTSSNPSLMMWNNILWCVYRGAKDEFLWCAAYYNGQWSDSTKFPYGNLSGCGPALVTAEIDGNGIMLCVHSSSASSLMLGNTQNLWWSQFQGVSVQDRGQWSADTQFSQGNQGWGTPSAIAYKGTVYCVHRGWFDRTTNTGDQNLWFCTFDGRNWRADIKFPSGNQSQSGVGLGVVEFP
jgi:hypothetical protein